MNNGYNKCSKSKHKTSPKYLILRVNHPFDCARVAYMAPDEAARVTGKSPRTVERWAREQAITCPASAKLLQYWAFGLCCTDDPCFSRISAREGRLWFDNGQSFAPGELSNISVFYELMRSLQRRVWQMEQAQGKRTPLCPPETPESAILFRIEDYRAQKSTDERA